MSTLDERTTRRGPDADGGSGVVEHGSADRRRRHRDRERRLRRTVVVAVGLLVLGAVVARAAEDPGTVRAGGVTSADALLTATGPGSTASARPTGDSAGDSAGVTVAPPASSAGATPSPTGAAGGASAPAGPPATVPTSARADAEGNGEEDTAGGATFTVPPAARAAVPDRGAGTVTPVEIPAATATATTSSASTSSASGRPVTYAVDVEDGLPVSAAEFATVVHDVLVDERGWQARDGVRFVPVSPAERAGGAHVDITVTLASPAYTAQLCAPLNTTTQQVSCWNGSRAVLNLARWVLGASTYGDALTEYRTYLVSHEVGHGLGHAHAHCTTPGEPAPVMVQQTKDLEGCVAWPWPTPPT